MLRAGVVAALIAGALTGVASPAQADDPDVQITVLNAGTLNAGQRTNLQFTVHNNNQQPTVFSIRVETFEGLACDGDCNIPARPINGDGQQGDTITVSATLVAANLNPGQTRSGQVRAIAQAPGGDEDSDERQLTVRGAQEAPTVKRVSGQIVDVSTGEPVSGAIVAMRDSQDHNFTAEANDNGRFSFTSSAQNPISPGRIDIAVGKTGYVDVEKNFTVAAGRSKTDIRIPLVSTASPSATPSAEGTGAPTGDAPSADAGQVAIDAAAGEDSGGALSWIFILLGGLLVALGVGAIVLLVVRRRQEGDDEDAVGAPGPPGGPRTAVPASRGAYHGAGDATRVVGAGMGADPTMLGRPGLADAPTMLQAPIRDEYPDPYGVPPGRPPQPAGPPTQAYGAAAQPGWGDNGYSDATQAGGYPGYGAPGGGGYGPPSGDAYGSPAAPRPGFGGPGGYDAGRGPGNGYGARDFAERGPERYDEPTGRFTPGGPESGAGAYGSGGGYDARGGYEPPTSAGYEPPASGGYVPPPTSGGGYPPPAGGGYGGPTSGAPAGYERGGYDQRGGGYEADPYSSAQGGHAGGYDQRGGYEPPPTGGYGGQGGYDQRGGGYGGQTGGYDVPEPRGGYDPRGGEYDQGGYYGDQGPPPSRHSAPPPQAPPPQPPPSRGERRSLDWLDD
jgi:hypothetical protein